MAIAFNGTTKRILITSPTALVSVKDDIYSAWKEWVLESDNSKYQPALRSIGGDPVGSGLYAGDIYFLINNWQIELDTIIKVTGTLYHDDGLDPFIVNPGGGVTATVSNLAYAYNTTGVIVPTAVEIRTEMDVNSARLAAIQAKTDTIVDPWLAQLADYIIAGTAGKILKDQAASITNIANQTDSVESELAVISANVATIPGKVWDEKLSNHTINGSYGYELATHSDIQASASTVISTYTSGAILAGIVVSGSIANTVIRDGVYWEVSETTAAGAGLTVEYIFNLASESDRAGTFNLYGRYDGKGSAHYIELWAWNVAGSAWEQLQEKFIPSSIVDAEYSQSYFEEHINRASSNEVKIRLVHNITTYHESHVLHIDSCNISAIDVITAEEIAEAVRVEMDANSVKLSQIQAGIAELANSNVTISLESITSLVTDIWNANITVYTTPNTTGKVLSSIPADVGNLQTTADTILAVSI